MSFSFCRVFVLCCIMFPVLDTGVLLWRSGWGHWGCDCFTQPPRWPLIFNQWDVEMLNSDYFHSQYCLLFKTFTNTYLVNMLKSVPAMCIQKQALPPPKKPFHSVPTITFTREHSFAHSLWTHALTWDQVFHPLWLPISFLLFFFSFSIGYSDRDLRAWPEPWGPLLLALCLPPGAAKYRGAAVILPDKRANIPCSPLMSPAKRTGSTLGPLGLIYPFFCSCKESTEASSLSGASAVTVWPHHTLTQPFRFPKSLMLHSPDSHCQVSCFMLLKRYVWERFLGQMNRLQLAGFPEETLGVNTVSRLWCDWSWKDGSPLSNTRRGFQWCWRSWALLSE